MGLSERSLPLLSLSHTLSLFPAMHWPVLPCGHRNRTTLLDLCWCWMYCTTLHTRPRAATGLSSTRRNRHGRFPQATQAPPQAHPFFSTCRWRPRSEPARFTRTASTPMLSLVHPLTLHQVNGCDGVGMNTHVQTYEYSSCFNASIDGCVRLCMREM